MEIVSRLSSSDTFIIEFVGNPSVVIAFHLTWYMHLHRSAHALRMLKLGAWHYVVNLVIGAAVLGLLGYALYSGIRFYLVLGALTLALWLLSLSLFFIRRLALRCPLCMVPLWAGNKCQKHRKVKPVLGVSYRLGVASSVIFKGNYRCPYCGEPFSARKSRRD